ncbi:hypothetical protein [Salmonella phage SSBI34]|nr:hypothetical protein [Salmonella phage SSBI34]
MALLKLVGFTGLRNSVASPTPTGWGSSIPSIFRVNNTYSSRSAYTYLNNWAFLHAGSSTQGILLMDGQEADESLMRLRIENAPGAYCGFAIDIRNMYHKSTPIGSVMSLGFSVLLTSPVALPVMYGTVNGADTNPTRFGNITPGVKTYVEFSITKATTSSLRVTKRVNEGVDDQWNISVGNINYLFLGNHPAVVNPGGVVTMDIGDVYYTYNEEGVDERLGSIRVKRLPTSLLLGG